MNKDRLGYYLVGWKKFYSKTLALIESSKTKYKPLWIFNDDVFSKINWSIPITTSLIELYRQRAQQLRETYDYIILYYSGGADSAMVLKTFLDNDIFIDEIVLLLFEPERKILEDMNTSAKNLYAEIDYIAIPELKKFSSYLNPKTKVTIQDCARATLELLSDEDWFEKITPGSSLSLGILSRQYIPLSVKHFADIFNSNKKTCQLFGVDKPLVWFDGKDYYAYFADNNAYHIGTVELNYTKFYNDKYITEWFFWTPDFPEIVIKQAQDIVAHCKVSDNKRNLWSKSLIKHIGEYRSVMHPIIYPGLDKRKFQTEKTIQGLPRDGTHDWFWEMAPIHVQNNYTKIFPYLDKIIAPEFSIEGSIANGTGNIKSRFYKL